MKGVGISDYISTCSPEDYYWIVDCLIRIKLPYFEGRYDKVSSWDEVCIRSNGSQASNILGFLLKHGRGWKSAAILAIYVLPGLMSTYWSLPRRLSHQVGPVADASQRGDASSTGRNTGAV